MTTAITSPGPLYNLLSLYAAVDQAVISTSDDAVSDIVELFMPGTAGDNAGWSLDLAELVGPMAPLGDALDGIASEPRQLTIPELSRLVFIIGVLIHLPGVLDEHDDERLTDVLMLAGPRDNQDRATAGRLRDWLRQEFNGWRDWVKVKGTPVAEKFLDRSVAQVPLCNAYLIDHLGRECVVIDTLFDDTELTLAKVKDILDLRNWDEAAGRFFVDMIPLHPQRTDGWARVLEITDLTGGFPFSYRLRTNLKYVKIDQGQYAGRLQYELDDFKPFPGDGDGQVTVDHGYINVRALNPGAATPGVRVVTRKVVRIEGFPPVLQKIWICALGYGHAAMEMIFRAADPKYMPETKWDDPPPPVAPSPPQGDGAIAAAAPEGGPPTKPYPPKTAGALAVTMAADCLQDTAKDSAALAAKWANGQLQVADLVQFSGKLGSRVASDAWIFFDKLNKLPPPNTGPGGGPYGGNT